MLERLQLPCLTILIHAQRLGCRDVEHTQCVIIDRMKIVNDSPHQHRLAVNRLVQRNLTGVYPRNARFLLFPVRQS